MDSIKVFEKAEFGQIRTIEMVGKPYFVASDIAKALGYKNISEAVDRHCRWVVKHDIPHPQSASKSLEVNVIPEGDLYRLISNSELPSALKFESWVFDEVLPSIRKTGFYENPNISTEMKAILMHDEKLVKMETRIDKLEYEIPLYGIEAEELSSHVKRKGVEVLKGKKSEAYKDANIRSKVYRDIYDQIKREFGIYSEDGKPRSYKALKRKYIADAHEVIDCYEAPMYLQELIEDANAQIQLETA